MSVTGTDQRQELPLPVVVVGNPSVGGTGDTIMCPSGWIDSGVAGWKPAINSRL
jgi:tetraacyldisaccharide-1-P 4'-kinase